MNMTDKRMRRVTVQLKQSSIRHIIALLKRNIERNDNPHIDDRLVLKELRGQMK